jgi:hypothetical protein
VSERFDERLIWHEQVRGELARLLGRRDPEFARAPQPIAQPRIRPKRSGTVADGGEADDQSPLGFLRQRIERHAPARQGNCLY